MVLGIVEVQADAYLCPLREDAPVLAFGIEVGFGLVKQ